MSYSNGEALLLTQVQNATDFNSGNTSRGDWKILNSGTDDHYAILKPGPFVRTSEGFRIHTATFRTVIEVWQRYKDDGTTLTTLEGYVANIIARVDQYRKLADTSTTLRDSNITGGSEVTEQWRNNADGPSWLKQDIYVDWMDESDVTYAE